MSKRGFYKPRLMFFLDDITTLRKGKLMVICPTEQRVSTSVVYECLCDCGNRAFMTTRQLKKYNSCGCDGKTKGIFKVIRKYGVCNG